MTMTYSRIFLLVSLALLLALGSVIFHHHQMIAVVTAGNGGCVDVAATPDYLSSKDPHDAIAAINYARRREHVHALRLPADFYQRSAVQQQFILLNLERTDRNLPPLSMDNTLSQLAQSYSQQMRDLGFFSHTSPIGGSFSERMNSNALLSNHYRIVAENLAGNPVAGIGPIYEYMYDDSVEACGHRQNMLDPQLQFVGIGLVSGSPYGSISAQEFLASAPWNPYAGGSVQQTKPNISMSVEIVGRQLRFTAQQATNDPLVRVTWFVDRPAKVLHVGNIWTVDAQSLPGGRHTVLAYGVDGVQQYAVARYVVGG